MKFYIRYFTIAAVLLMSTGCVQNNMDMLGGTRTAHSQDNGTWGYENSNDGENIDISDLDQNLTESELGMTEEVQEPKMKRIPFPVSEYNRLARLGKGTIKGTIYITTPYGQKVVGSGTRLYLNPVTSYSNQWYNESYIAGNKMEKADARLFNYLKFTAADKNGAFAFYGVPSGSYYLIGTVECASECGYDTPKSIRIASRVSVSGNQVVTQDLSRFVD